MKKIKLYLAMLSLGVCVLSGCAAAGADAAQQGRTASSGKAQDEIIVFAAASLTETFEEIGAEFEKQGFGISVTFNFDSSGTLKTQIEEGADCDLFVSASPKQMDQLDITADPGKNPDGLDIIDPDTRTDLLENKVVLAVPEGNPAGITDFESMAEKLHEKSILLAMGNEDVPVGQYTQKILEYYGLDEGILSGEGLITYGSNVKEVTSQVSEAAADCGIIYSTDAYSAGLDVIDAATEEMCGKVIYPAAVLKQSRNMAGAKAFLLFLKSEDSRRIFEKVGFTCRTGG